MSDEKVVAQDALFVDEDEDAPLKAAKGEFQDGPNEEDES